MAKTYIPRFDYYVYILFTLNGRPFYVGKGSKGRWYHHERDAEKEKSQKNTIILEIKSAGKSVPKIKVREGLSENEALRTEMALIAAIGRQPDGPLTNMTTGGDGCSEFMSGRPISAEHKARLHAGRRLRGNTAEHNAAIVESNKKRIQSLEQRMKSSLVHKGKIISLAHREIIRKANLGRVPTANTIRIIREKAIGRVFTREHRANISRAKRRMSAERNFSSDQGILPLE